MNNDALLALIGNLYAQLVQAQNTITEQTTKLTNLELELDRIASLAEEPF